MTTQHKRTSVCSRAKLHYTPSSKMADLLCDHYCIFLLIFNFDIKLGVGEKTIREVCQEYDIDVDTFIYLVNFLLNDELASHHGGVQMLDVSLLIKFLGKSHSYFLEYRLPQIRTRILETLKTTSQDIEFVIKRYFDEYAEEVNQHMSYENDVVFPYVEGLLKGQLSSSYSIQVFEQKHDQIELKMIELKNILIKYYTGGDPLQLNNVLHELYTCGDELFMHNAIEDKIFIPCIKEIEEALVKKK